MANVTQNELLWREWILGEGRFKKHGPRNRAARPDVRFGGPGQKPVPRAWWQRLEAFLARRYDKSEPKRTPPSPPRKPGPVKRANDPAQLTEHFNVREFDCHDGRRVPLVAVPALERLCERILEPMRAEFGACDVMSGYRPADYNRRIGGASLSQHIYELGPDSVAADLTFAHGRPSDWYRMADSLGAGGAGRYPGFVHVDNRPGRARWSG
jgi:hypothetical protein